MLIEFYFTPELHLKDGHIIRDLNDAASFSDGWDHHDIPQELS